MGPLMMTRMGPLRRACMGLGMHVLVLQHVLRVVLQVLLLLRHIRADRPCAPTSCTDSSSSSVLLGRFPVCVCVCVHTYPVQPRALAQRVASLLAANLAEGARLSRLHACMS